MTRPLPTSPLRRWGVFNVVGVAGFVVQIALVTVLTRACGWHYLLATTAAMLWVIAQNYVAHARWTWADRPPSTSREARLRPLRYAAAKSVSLSANVLLTATFVTRGDVAPELATSLAVVICAVFNYIAADRIVFSRSDARSSPKGQGNEDAAVVLLAEELP